MSKKLDSQLEYEVTCEKLSNLQQMRKEAEERQSENPYVKELTLRSLGRLIKQLQEEKIWYECHTGSRKPTGPAVTSMPHSGETPTRETSSPCTN
jgi:hypothetical protein